MFDSDKRDGRYEILRVVNRGGMGEIALGRVKGTKGFEKLVVLKRLRADAEREDHIHMFDVEQELMSRIEHPNIVKVFDQPVLNNTPYLAMEYVRGRNLDQIIRRAARADESIQLTFTLSIVSEVLRGLAFVHRLKDNEGRALGVVHQDMTPSNVMVSFFGEVKITDFGISYVTSRDGGLRKGVLKGKPRYVAPEVLAGKRVNNRADIYGLAVVLYEMLVGKALFARSSVKETLSAVAKNDLPDFIETLGPKYGEGVCRVLEKSLKKDPQERYRTAEIMAADVLNELAKLGGPMPPANIGYFIRQLFLDDPDVPEMDPALDAALSKEQMPAALQPQDLDSTLQELDRLLGPEHTSSVDLFTLPPELMGELDDMEDMDPFAAATPIPDFVWDAKDDAELLSKANEAFGSNPIVAVEPPPLDSSPTKPLTSEPKESEEEPKAEPEKKEDVNILEPVSDEVKTDGAYSQMKSDNRNLTDFTEPPTPPEPSPREPTPPPPNAPTPGLAIPKVTPRPVSHVPPPKSSFQFWLGVAVGLGMGMVIGAVIFMQLQQ